MEGDFIKILIVVGYILYWLSKKFLNQTRSGARKEGSGPKKKSVWDEFKDQFKEEMRKAQQEMEGQHPKASPSRSQAPPSTETFGQRSRGASTHPSSETFGQRSRGAPTHPSSETFGQRSRGAERHPPAFNEPVSHHAKQASAPLEVTLEEYLKDKEQKHKEEATQYSENRFEEGRKKKRSQKSYEKSGAPPVPEISPSSLDAGIGGGLASEDPFAVYGDMDADVHGDVHGTIFEDFDEESGAMGKSGEPGKQASPQEIFQERGPRTGGIIDRLQQNYTDEQLMLVLAEVMAPYGESPHRPE